MTFENYLQQQHAKVYVGLDDDMPDSFDSWLCDLQPDDFINHYFSAKRRYLMDKIFELVGAYDDKEAK